MITRVQELKPADQSVLHKIAEKLFWWKRPESALELLPRFLAQVMTLGTWDDVKAGGRKAVGLETLHATLTRLLGEQHTVFEESWQRLTLPQRAVLRALVLEDGRELLSADVRTRHRLPTASSVQSALAALVRQDVIMREATRYMVSDSLYREWVARRTY